MRNNILGVACALICLTPALSLAQNLSDQKIEFDKTSINVKQIVNTLDNYLDVNAPKNFNWNYNIDLPSETIELDKLIEVIQSTTPYILQLENNRLVITEKKIEKKYNISGKINDAETGEPLVGANIYLKQSGTGSVSNPDGSYQMVLSPGKHILVYSFVGYNKLEKTIYLFDNKAININLTTEQKEIEEVKISTSRHLFGDLETGRTIEKIDSKVIESLPLNMVSDVLHGSVKGVWSTKMSGAPGDHQKLRIRGISSILGSTDPLYVIDGMPVPIVNLKSLGISDLNIHDIENISILKDASSTALYGYHGGNGVILIDTKKGGGETEFSFSTKIGFQKFSKRYDLLKTEEFLWNLQQSDRVLGTDFYLVNPDRDKYEEYPVYIDTAGNVMGYTNWQDRIFKTGIINEYQFSAKGQIKPFNYYLSANIFNHEGVVLSSKYKKKTFTGSINRSFKEKLNIGFQLRFSNEKNENNLDSYFGNKMILKGINTEPAFVTTPDSFLYKSNRFFINNSSNSYSEIIDRLSNTSISPDSIAMYKRNQDTKIYTGNLFFKLNIFDNLHLNSTLSGSFREMRYITDEEPDLLKSDEGIVILHHQTNLSYFNDIEKHHIQLTLGMRNYTDNTYWEIDTMYQQRRRYSSGADIYLRGSQAKYGPKGASIRSIHSMLGHLNYSYNDKYFISLVANYDHLIDGDYLDVKSLFPSVAINYDVSREMFLNRIRRLDYLNLYYNWGKSGNYPLNSLSGDIMNNDYYYINDDNPAVFYHNLANHHIKHEEVNEQNFGFELGLFQERIVFQLDYFEKTNTNLILSRDIPLYFGGGFFFYNVGEMLNKGIELSFELVPVKSYHTFWKLKFGYTQNNQRITKLDNGDALHFYDSDILIPYFEAAKNEKLGVILAYDYAGEWTEDETPETGSENGEPVEPEINYIEHRGMKYVKYDTLNPSRLVDEDRTIIGKSIPDYTCFWTNTIQYKAFTLEFLWYATIGVDKYNATKASTYITGVNSEVSRYVADTLNHFLDKIFYESSYFVENASFIRLKYITLTYKHPKPVFNKANLSLSVNLDNVITLTKYSGYDPESSIYTDNNFTDNALDMGGYPNPTGVIFSINLTF